MKEEYKLEKRIWSEKDFQKMGWHDCAILALAWAKHDLLIDIDYILKWVESSISGGPYKFWVSPATLIFKNISGWAVDISIESWNFEGHHIEIDDIEREALEKLRKFGIGKDIVRKDKAWKWTIMLHQGDIVFRSTGYKQYIRKEPILIDRQRLGLKERGGISFSTSPDG